MATFRTLAIGIGGPAGEVERRLRYIEQHLLRHQKRFGRLVERQIANGETPTPNDVAAALETAAQRGEKLPASVLKYVAKYFVRSEPRQKPKNAKRTTIDDFRIRAVYEEELARAKGDLEVNSRDVGRVAKQRTIRRMGLGVSIRRLEQILEESPWRAAQPSLTKRQAEVLALVTEYYCTAHEMPSARWISERMSVSRQRVHAIVQVLRDRGHLDRVNSEAAQ